MRSILRALAGAFLGSLAIASGAQAQSYAINNPTYIPTAILAPTTISAVGTVALNSQGLGTVFVRLTGTYTGLAAAVQCSSERSPSTVTWSTLGVEPASGGGGALKALTANGFYKVNATGCAQLQLNVTAISTGSVVVDMAGTQAASMVSAAPTRRATYSATVVALAPAAATTDFITLTGSASTTIRVDHVECSGISTANATATIEALIRSTANSAGTSGAMTAVPHDSADPAATGTALSYTANPTTGTLVGIVRGGKLTTTTAATSSVAAQVLTWDFGNRGMGEDVTLRGATQVFALNGAAGTFSAGTALNCSLEWTEE